ncbi:MAG: hypothetical protein U9O20_04285 [Patescibacteria group bacterium]|nr:hypothetical protein [Patescibacteria group bacterium]
MVKKIHPKTETTIETDHFEIVACKDSQLQSFLNVFHLEGETPIQSKLGEVFGVIQVHDHSEQSAYLPNLITQVIRKEFYKNSKRPTGESFEAALHKANSALAELAQHELVGWHGKLDAAIGVVNNGHFFFTQTNKGKIFLIRDKKIVEISKGLDEPANNPMKTFSDVSSGVVEIYDKVIFSTPSIHEPLPFEDLKRHSNTFSSDEFDNLIKSTLETEGENVGAIVVNFQEKTIAQAPAKNKRRRNKNYFGKNDEYKKEKKSKDDMKKREDEKEKDKSDLAKKTEAIINGDKKEKEENEKMENEIQNKNLSPFEKQPELFIKEGDQGLGNTESEDSAIDSLKNKSNKIVEKIKKNLPFSENKKGIKSKKTEIKKEERAERKKEIFTKKESLKGVDSEKFSTEIPPVKKIKKSSLSSNSFFEEDMLIVDKKKYIKFSDKTDMKLKNFWSKDSRKTNIYKEKIKDIFKKKETLSLGTKKLIQKAKNATKKITATDQKSDIHGEGKFPLKIIAIIIVLFLFIVGIFYVVSIFSNRNDASKDEQVFDEEAQQEQKEPASVNDNTTEVKKVVDLEADVVSMAYDDGSIFMLTALNSFYRYETHNGTLEEISAGQHIKNPRTIGTINNLNLILLVSNEKVVNYNRVTKSFDENKVDLPEELDVISVGSYLSYFYIFDRKSGQIYRYSRDTDKPVVWLKDSIDASGATDMVIDDSIRLVYSDGSIEKYFKNKKENSFLLDYEPKITPAKITTAIDHDYYYVLDDKQGVVGMVNKETDHVERTFKNSKIIGAKDLHFDVKENKIYFVSSDAQLMMIGL